MVRPDSFPSLEWRKPQSSDNPVEGWYQGKKIVEVQYSDLRQRWEYKVVGLSSHNPAASDLLLAGTDGYRSMQEAMSEFRARLRKFINDSEAQDSDYRKAREEICDFFRDSE